MCHGIFSEKNEDGRYTRLASLLSAAGYSSWRFDFLGHGESRASTESFTVAAALADFLIVAAAHRSAFPAVPRSVVASSFGGSIVLLAALAGHLAELAYDRLVLLNPVTDYRSSFLEPFGAQLQEVFTPEALSSIRHTGSAEVKPGFVFGLPALLEFELLSPAAGFTHIDIPTLILHGDQDTAVSHDIVKRDSAVSPVTRFVTIPGASHSFVEPEAEERTFRLISEFLVSPQVPCA
jgi:alpha-beta hydrolase superfamily lysophospholipase